MGMPARAQRAGVIREDVGLDWARRVCHALIHEAAQSEGDPDEPATRLVDTLLRGVGAEGLKS
jgi:hypothetical protein